MKIILNEPVKGYKQTNEKVTDFENYTLHAEAGDVLTVIFNNPTHYICESIKHPGLSIAVFPHQVADIIEETVEKEDRSFEEYYQTVEVPDKSPEDDPFYRALFSDEDE